jgi:hypothetical protein
MSRTKIDAVTRHLVENAGRLRYGTVSAVLRIHEGRVVSIYYETNETLKEREGVYNEAL